MHKCLLFLQNQLLCWSNIYLPS